MSITLPAALLDIASRIARALDPDVGGEKSFRADLGGETISATTPCTADYKALMLTLQTDPSALHALVLADYAARWPTLTPPTLSEVQAFCVAAEWA